MKKIEVEVSENASIAEISSKITKQLIKAKELGYNGNNKLQIGEGKTEIELIDNGLQINVIRALSKHDELKKCHCGTEYMKSAGFRYKNNYGGKNKVNTVCSSACFDLVKEICGDRVAKIRSRLAPIIKAPDYIQYLQRTEEKSQHSIQIKKEGDNVGFYRNGISIEPTREELYAICAILEIANIK